MRNTDSRKRSPQTGAKRPGRSTGTSRAQSRARTGESVTGGVRVNSRRGTSGGSVTNVGIGAAGGAGGRRGGRKAGVGAGAGARTATSTTRGRANAAKKRPSTRPNAGASRKVKPRTQRVKNTVPAAQNARVTRSAPQNSGAVKRTDGNIISNLATLQTGDITLTRRQLIVGAAGVAALAVVGTGVYSCATGASESAAASTLSVPESAVISESSLTEIDASAAPFAEERRVSLPYGTLVWTNNATSAVCIVPTEAGSPLNEVRLLALDTGNTSTLLSAAVGADDGFEILDARASETGLVWVESNVLEGSWRVYQAPLSALSQNAEGVTSASRAAASSSSSASATSNGAAATAAAAAILCAQGNSDWELPALAAVGSWAFWQLLPSSSGSAAAEPSTLTRVQFGSAAASAEVVYSAAGKMACAPASTEAGVAIAPRAAGSSSRYQLTYIDASTGAVTDRLTLPSSMKPNYLTYGPHGFSFSFEGIYDVGDGISNLGTYTPTQAPTLDFAGASADATATTAQSKHKGDVSALTDVEQTAAETRAANAICDLYSAQTWFRYTRTPLTTPAWCGNYMIVKSTKNVVALDTSAQTFYAFSLENGAPSYGEFLSTSGQADKIVTFTNVDYTPVNGSETKECIVKIYARA